jgi:dTDP-4-amino-4,6-dideoxygalactose transaminase
MVFLQGMGAMLMVRVEGDERMLVFIPYLSMQIVYTVLVINFARRKGVTFLVDFSPKTAVGAKKTRYFTNNAPNYEDWPFFGEQEQAAVSEVLASGKVNYRTGEHGRQFENEFAKSVGCEFGVALANGSVSLELALIALGIGEGDEVIVPSYTFIASASSVVLRGATPIFADVDPITINISAASIRNKISERTKAIIAVHLLGCPCDMDAILAIAKEFDIYVIEDCAQAHGATYKGKPVGSFGDVAAFSFCQDKIMSTGGEGGMLTTNSEELREKSWAYKDHGKNRRMVEEQRNSGFSWVHDSFGTNWRMTEMQAVLGRLQLEKLSNWVLTRQSNASIMDNLLRGREGIKLPRSDAVLGHAYYKYTIQVDPNHVSPGWSRDRIIASLNDDAVPCASGICPEVYMEKAFRHGGYFDGMRLPVAREIGERAIQFQVHPTILKATMEKRARTVADLLDRILK